MGRQIPRQPKVPLNLRGSDDDVEEIQVSASDLPAIRELTYVEITCFNGVGSIGLIHLLDMSL